MSHDVSYMTDLLSAWYRRHIARHDKFYNDRLFLSSSVVQGNYAIKFNKTSRRSHARQPVIYNPRRIIFLIPLSSLRVLLRLQKEKRNTCTYATQRIKELRINNVQLQILAFNRYKSNSSFTLYKMYFTNRIHVRSVGYIFLLYQRLFWCNRLTWATKNFKKYIIRKKIFTY